LAGLDRFVVLFEFGVAEGHVEKRIFIVGVRLFDVFVVQLDPLLVSLAPECLVAALL
jgi:hypothetical protein